tara:strand:+ start:43 stop:888 length:846 start_codon:yes stop_codon:yes gene_type:complete
MTDKINLFIIGMQKAGTTSIFNFLSKSNLISYTKIKETNFFADNFPNISNYNSINLHTSKIINKHDLKNTFIMKKNSKFLLEGSVNNFYSKNAPQKIYTYNPSAKIILILRDPIQRLMSHYFMDLNLGLNTKDINQSLLEELSTGNSYGSDLGYLKMSVITKNYENWTNFFSPKNILLINFEDLKNQDLIKKKLKEFLFINFDNINLNIDNVGRVPRFIEFNKLIMKIRGYFPLVYKPQILKNLYKFIFFKKNKSFDIHDNVKEKLHNYFKEDYEFLQKYF